MVNTASITRHDTRAARVASVVHDALNPVQTILFGSRARGDYRWYSDIDIFVITADETEPDYREYAKSVAEQARKELLPEADKTDVICWTLRKFLDNRCLKNNLANHVARDGLPIMPPEEIGYSSDYGAESVDWNNVRTRVRDAMDNSYAIQHTVDPALTPEKVLGHIAQQALEHGYKAALGRQRPRLSRGLARPRPRRPDRPGAGKTRDPRGGVRTWRGVQLSDGVFAGKRYLRRRPCRH